MKTIQKIPTIILAFILPFMLILITTSGIAISFEVPDNSINQYVQEATERLTLIFSEMKILELNLQQNKFSMEEAMEKVKKTYITGQTKEAQKIYLETAKYLFLFANTLEEMQNLYNLAQMIYNDTKDKYDTSGGKLPESRDIFFELESILSDIEELWVEIQKTVGETNNTYVSYGYIIKNTKPILILTGYLSVVTSILQTRSSSKKQFISRSVITGLNAELAPKTNAGLEANLSYTTGEDNFSEQYFSGHLRYNLRDNINLTIDHNYYIDENQIDTENNNLQNSTHIALDYQVSSITALKISNISSYVNYPGSSEDNNGENITKLGFRHKFSRKTNLNMKTKLMSRIYPDSTNKDLNQIKAEFLLTHHLSEKTNLVLAGTYDTRNYPGDFNRSYQKNITRTTINHTLSQILRLTLSNHFTGVHFIKNSNNNYFDNHIIADLGWKLSAQTKFIFKDTYITKNYLSSGTNSYIQNTVCGKLEHTFGQNNWLELKCEYLAKKFAFDVDNNFDKYSVKIGFKTKPFCTTKVILKNTYSFKQYQNNSDNNFTYNTLNLEMKHNLWADTFCNVGSDYITKRYIAPSVLKKDSESLSYFLSIEQKISETLDLLLHYRKTQRKETESTEVISLQFTYSF